MVTKARAKRAAAPSRGRPEPRVAVFVAAADGRVLDMNRPAIELLGDGRRQLCWEIATRHATRSELPCAEGCTHERIACGIDSVTTTRVTIDDARYDLTCAPVGDSVVTTLSPIDAPREDLKLSGRQIQVLRLLARGLTVPETAAALGIRSATVRTHVEHMRNKLGAATQAALVARGYSAGYLP